MSRSVAGVVELARDRHVAFDIRSQPAGPLYRFLGSYIQGLAGRIMQVDPTITGIEQTLEYDLPLNDFGAGLALGPNRIVMNVIARDPEQRTPRRSYPIELISRDQRFAPNRPRVAAWQEGDLLYLAGRALDWDMEGTLDVTVMAPMGDEEMAALQLPGAMLPLPDEAADAIAAALAEFMAQRAGTFDAPSLSIFASVRSAAETTLLQAIGARQVGRTFITADVWRP